jgi:hypothetical protein
MLIKGLQKDIVDKVKTQQTQSIVCSKYVLRRRTRELCRVVTLQVVLAIVSLRYSVDTVWNVLRGVSAQ